MQRGQPLTLIDGKLPVFVFPSSLTFYTDDQTSHKQVLTIYNPYDFTITFKVLCTARKKYSVVDSEGSIKSKCCVDIVVRHRDISLKNEGLKDKFRIQIFEHGRKTIIGRKDVIGLLLPTKEAGQMQGQDDTFESLPPPSVTDAATGDTLTVPGRGRYGNFGGAGPSLVVVLTAVVCLVALMLPTSGEDDSVLPPYLHLATPQKLIAAYVLGLVTMAILRS